MKILALGSNSIKFYTHNLWATRMLEMQKLDADGEVMGVVVQETRGGCGGGMGWRVCSGVQGDAGAGCGGPGGVAPWLARGAPKAGLAASFYIISFKLSRKTIIFIDKFLPNLTDLKSH